MQGRFANGTTHRPRNTGRSVGNHPDFLEAVWPGRSPSFHSFLARFTLSDEPIDAGHRQSRGPGIGEKKRANGRQGPIDIPRPTVGTTDPIPVGALQLPSLLVAINQWKHRRARASA